MTAIVLKWVIVALYVWSATRNIRFAGAPSLDKPAGASTYAVAAVLATLLAVGVAVYL